MKRILALLILLSNLSIIASDGPAAGAAPLSDPSLFPEETYNAIMLLIADLNFTAFELLMKCHELEKRACILQSNTIPPGIYYHTDRKYEYPNIILDPDIMLDTPDDIKDQLNYYADEYSKSVAKYIPSVKRLAVLEVIAKIAPALHTLITTFDPTGKNHIQNDINPMNASIAILISDGLPLFIIGNYFIDETDGEKQFTIAHELSHYVLGHITHKKGLPNETEEDEVRPGLLKINETFSNSQQRIREFEADRFAVLGFGIDVNDAIKYMQNEVIQDHEHAVPKETFKRTHPLFSARLQQLQQLKYDLEMGHIKAQIADINWEELASEYKIYWESN